jgi:thioredoxin 1
MKQLLKFSATWCGPCKSLSKIIETMDMKEIELVEVDIDENVDKAVDYGVRGVPTLIMLEDGKEVRRKTGLLSAEKLEAFIHG